jgi:hypothetical protein
VNESNAGQTGEVSVVPEPGAQAASRIKGPNAWLIGETGKVSVTVACRDCGWALEILDVPESEVHQRLDVARAAFASHDCRAREPKNVV